MTRPAVSDETGRAKLALLIQERVARMDKTRSALGFNRDDAMSLAMLIYDNSTKVIAALSAVPVETWKCAARKQSLPEPADCGWPTCGCDPHADKVIAALEEQGHTAPVAQEPVAWVEFTEAGLIRFWTSDPARAEVERTKRSLTKFTLSELIALVGRPRTPPATPAGVGASAEEIARVVCDAMSNGNIQLDEAGQTLRTDCLGTANAILSLLSRAEGE